MKRHASTPWLGPTLCCPSCSAAFLHLQVSLERYIDIPQEILDVYKLWR